MKVERGRGRTVLGPGVLITLTGDEVAHAIDIYLLSQDVIVRGSRTIRSPHGLIETHEVYVDPSGSVIHDGERVSGSPAPSITLAEYADQMGQAIVKPPMWECECGYGQTDQRCRKCKRLRPSQHEALVKHALSYYEAGE